MPSNTTNLLPQSAGNTNQTSSLIRDRAAVNQETLTNQSNKRNSFLLVDNSNNNNSKNLLGHDLPQNLNNSNQDSELNRVRKTSTSLMAPSALLKPRNAQSSKGGHKFVR